MAASRPSERRHIMSYAIIGFGAIGQALARAFARRNMAVAVASRRPAEALAPQARTIGPTVIARSLRDAVEAGTIILAVPFGEHREVAKALPNWHGKTIIDAMNTFGVPPEELDGLPSSAFAAKAEDGRPSSSSGGTPNVFIASMIVLPCQFGRAFATSRCSPNGTARMIVPASTASRSDLAMTVGPIVRACGANASAGRRLATATAMFLRAKARARAWPIAPNPMIA